VHNCRVIHHLSHSLFIDISEATDVTDCQRVRGVEGQRGKYSNNERYPAKSPWRATSEWEVTNMTDGECAGYDVPGGNSNVLPIIEVEARPDKANKTTSTVGTPCIPCNHLLMRICSRKRLALKYCINKEF
jgi:hypothetical protein